MIGSIPLRILIVSLTLAALGCAEPPQRPRPVGLTFRAYEDQTRRDWSDTRSRPLATAVWYPAARESREHVWRVGIFDAGWNAQHAPLAADAGELLPLVVLSHGTGGGAATLSWLAETLASEGYLVAAVNHHGNTAVEPAYRLEGFMLWWERARDLSVLIDRLLDDPEFGPRVDRSRIGVAGFSLGGYTALAAVGGRLDYERWKTFCAAHPRDPNCNLPPEVSFTMADVERALASNPRVRAAIDHAADSYQDARIRSAFVMAPVLGPALTPESLGAIARPVRIVVGSRDEQAIPSVNAEPIAAAIPGAVLEIAPDISHYTFLAPARSSGGCSHVRSAMTRASTVSRSTARSRRMRSASSTGRLGGNGSGARRDPFPSPRVSRDRRWRCAIPGTRRLADGPLRQACATFLHATQNSLCRCRNPHGGDD